MSSRPLSVLQILEKGHFNTGSVVQMFQLAENLSLRGHRVAVVSRGTADPRAVPGGRHRLSRPSDAKRIRPRFGARLARIYREREVEAVHVHKGIAHSIALEATFLGARRPVIVVNRGVSFPLDAFNRIKFHVRLGAVVTVCEDIKKVIVESGRLTPGQVRVIYAGVDLAVFDPARLTAEKCARSGGSVRRSCSVQVGAREWKGWNTVEATAIARKSVPRLRTAIVACRNEEQKKEIVDFGEPGSGRRGSRSAFATTCRTS